MRMKSEIDVLDIRRFLSLKFIIFRFENEKLRLSRSSRVCLIYEFRSLSVNLKQNSIRRDFNLELLITTGWWRILIDEMRILRYEPCAPPRLILEIPSRGKELFLISE